MISEGNYVQVASLAGCWPVPGKGQAENPSRKQLCVSTYVARSSLLLILGQLKLTLAPRAGTWPLGQQVPFPSAAEAPTHTSGDGGGMTRKGWSQTLQPGVAPARGTCCNLGAIP